jgi:two-component system LytT family sensor kinase
MRIAIIFAAWSLFAICMAGQEYYSATTGGRRANWSWLLRSELTYSYVWALLTPVILWMARRFPVVRWRWYRAVPLHAAACVVLTCVQKSAFDLLAPRAPGYQPQPHDLKSLWHSILLTMDYGVLLYGIVLLVHYTVEYYDRYQEGRIRASQLEAQLAQAQLQALKMQLHPHFLFNTLHSISTLVQENPEAADAMIARLSELLRLSLENTGAQQVPLSKEIEFVERYLEIEQIRFQDRLQIRFDIDPKTLDAEVPNLILQPLVENAIRHGIGQDRIGRIDIRARFTGAKLLLQVIDNGPGLGVETVSNSVRCGLGLANTRARLEAIYGKEHNFVVRDASNVGVEAAILIPPRPPAEPLVPHDWNGKNQDADRR